MYRKVLLAASLARAVEEIALASLGMAALGFALYALVYPSGIVLFEALVWSIEAMAFAGVSLAFRVASSRALFYRARYEVFRLEALAVVILSAVGLGVTLLVMARSLLGGREASTPPLLGLYPLAGALVSYGLDSLLERRAGGHALRLVSLAAVSSKLRYDVVFEVAGGAGLLAAGLLREPLIEEATLLAVGAYVAYGLAAMAVEHMLYLIGPGPRHRRLELRAKIRRAARSMGLRVSKMRVEVYGTFAEAEVWIPLRPDATLAEANRAARELARRLVHSIPELLRVVVIPLPHQPRGQPRPRGHQRYRRRKPRQHGGQGEPGAAQGTGA
ncbi:MAG: cobalt transporter [Desulfurococcales archaeon]|nr:cobalt transporter [Desulfurococcales archaeon]